MRLSFSDTVGGAKKYFVWRGLLLGLGACILAGLTPSAVRAVTTISQGFITDDQVALGSIVSLDNDSVDHVSPASNNNSNSIIGVVIGDGNSLLTLSNGEESQIQVATNGIVQVLVSDINGDLVQGDQITASPIGGVGMKATDNVKVVGIAQNNLTENNSSVRKYKDKDGNEQTVRFGQIPVLINVAFYFKQPDKSIIPSAVQNVANALAGKQVNPLPILISAGVFVITIVVVVSIIYSMIHSSIISVGRNPMSQAAIYRDLIQMSGLVVGILVVATVSIYMILTRF